MFVSNYVCPNGHECVEVDGEPRFCPSCHWMKHPYVILEQEQGLFTTRQVIVKDEPMVHRVTGEPRGE